MKNSKFQWGKIIETFDYDFDGESVSIIKYHPNLYSNGDSGRYTGKHKDIIMFHCEQINESSDRFMSLLISWITAKQLGRNNGSLAAGICRALCIKEDRE